MQKLNNEEVHTMEKALESSVNGSGIIKELVTIDGNILFKVIFIDGCGKLVARTCTQRRNAEYLLAHLTNNYSTRSYYD